MRLTDLRDAILATADGQKLGRVHEVHCERGRIVALICGPGSLIERLTAKDRGRKIPWECVLEVEHRRILVDLDARKDPHLAQLVAGETLGDPARGGQSAKIG